MVNSYVVDRKGRRYVYRSTSVYDPETGRKRTVSEYVGRIDPETGRLIEKRGRDHSDGTVPGRPAVRKLGACHALASLSESIGLTGDLRTAFGDDGGYILAMAMSLIVSGGSRYSVYTEMDSNMSRQILGIREHDTVLAMKGRLAEMCTERSVDALFRGRVERAGRVAVYARTASCNEENALMRYMVASDTDGMPVFMKPTDAECLDVRDVVRITNRMAGHGASEVVTVLDALSGKADLLRYLMERKVQFLALVGERTPAAREAVNGAVRAMRSSEPTRYFGSDAFAVSEAQLTVCRMPADSRRHDPESSDVPGFSLVADPECPPSMRMRTWACIPLETNGKGKGLREAVEKAASELSSLSPEEAAARLEEMDGTISGFLDVDVSGGGVSVRIRRKALTARANREDAFVMATHRMTGWQSSMTYASCSGVPEHLSEIMDDRLTTRVRRELRLPEPCVTAIRLCALSLWTATERLLDGTDHTVTTALQTLDTIFAVSDGRSWTVSSCPPEARRVLRALGVPTPPPVLTFSDPEPIFYDDDVDTETEPL